MRYAIMLFFMLTSMSSAFAGVLTIEDAEKMFIENNFELKEKRIELKKYDAEVIGAGLLQNPTFTYSIESLKNGERGSEETYSISQSINIIGIRGLKIDTAEKRKKAQYLLYEQKVLDSISTMKQVYYRIILLKENAGVMKGIHERLVDTENKIFKRLEVGDVSEVELMRLRAERRRLEMVISGIESEMRTEKSKLAMLLNFPLEKMDLKEGLYYEPLILDADELSRLAIENRGDIKAASVFVDASNSSLKLSKKEAFEPIEVEVGYKKSTGGFNGFIFGVSIPLPLFNRNQDSIASAIAELEANKIREELLKKSVLNEVNILFERLTSLNARINDLMEQIKTSKEITGIVSLLYEEGEASLIEMLDAARLDAELTIERNNLIYEYLTALFELQKAVGTRYLNTGGAR